MRSIVLDLVERLDRISAANAVRSHGPEDAFSAKRVEALLADKGYDADAVRAELAAAGVEAVIPTKSNRRIPIPQDCAKYR